MAQTLATIDARDDRPESDRLVHEWRQEQLQRLGVTRQAARVVAGFVDWHDIARLVDRGCPPWLAIEIVR
jgi:hypothetical protein